jgi:bile acid-coenzyme A ligase
VTAAGDGLTALPAEPISYGRNLTERAARYGSRLAFVTVAADGTERRVTWDELERRANQVGRRMARAGVTAGSLVAIAIPNSAEHFFAAYGAWKLGATVLPLRWSLPKWEHDRLVDLAEPALVVVVDEASGRRELPLSAIIASVDLDDSPLPDNVPDPAQAIATSGSTGGPKLIVKSIPGLLRPREAADTLDLPPLDVVQLVTSPLYHTNGFLSHLRLMIGGTLVVMEHFDAALTVDLIERWQVNHVVLVPTMLHRIARLADLTPEKLSSLQIVFYGGGSLAPWVARRWLELVGPDRFEFQYGGTEGLGACVASGREWLTHEGTVGRARGCDLRIQDPSGAELPRGSVGEIYLRPYPGTPPFRYIGAPMPPTTPDGYSTFGDLGWQDDEDYVYIADRRVDMVVTGGVNVFPAEVEAALTEHESVGDVVVIGLPDDEWGHRLHAIVEPANSATPPTAEELRRHLKERLASYKVPKEFEIVAHIGRTEAGKINRSALVTQRAGSAET